MSLLDRVLKHAGESNAEHSLGLGPLLSHRSGQRLSSFDRVRPTVLRTVEREVARILGDIDHVIMKGPRLGELLFGNAKWRSSGDVDVLVRPSDLLETIRRLRAEGLVSWAEPDLGRDHQWPLDFRGITVEVHWSIAIPRVPQPSVELFFRYHDTPEEILAVLAYHYFNHPGFLKGLVDLSAWWDRYGASADWNHPILLDVPVGLLAWPRAVLSCISGEEQAGPIDDRLGVQLLTGWAVEATRNVLSEVTPGHPSIIGHGRAPQWLRMARTASMALLLEQVDRPRMLLEPILQGASRPQDVFKRIAHVVSNLNNP